MQTTCRRLVATVGVGLVLLVLLPPSTCEAANNYLKSVRQVGTDWGAQSWTADDLALFGGEPAVAGTNNSSLVVRYHYFVSDYDTALLAPTWVAHVDTRESAQAADVRKGGQWDRGQYTFTPDENIVTYSQDHNLKWVTNADYTNANPPALRPVTARNRITRGHMASNLEMKGHGDDSTGMESQKESFSFANVCPQMQGHNAPLWAALENDCLALAVRLGRVAVITGPVYLTDATHPVQSTKAPRGKVRIPIPTHFFKIIIAQVAGRTEAVAFLIPHRYDLKADQRFDYAVSVRQVEQVTHINFMPALGANDEVEDQPSDDLLDLLHEE
ncbi:MAG TPA: DNA/RNA non-specific endonuclease [Opitutaceae bacterium]|nr:DNA/RNA non-specific endonuclease [Opitutaceae bacterium]HND60466.1 DNA/RNA non-specific endonuclease [Opitutaceae bacterium]